VGGTVRALLVGDDGQDLIEYGLLASLIAITVIAAVVTLGAAVDALWQTIPAQVPSGS
jgi:Flp pilus assembly pilin Flp